MNLPEQFFSFKNGLEAVVSILALSQAVFLLSGTRKKKAPVILSLFFIIVGAHFALLNIHNIFQVRAPYIALFLLSTYGPLSYLLTLSIVRPQQTTQKLAGVFVLLAVSLIPIYTYLPMGYSEILLNVWTVGFLMASYALLIKGKKNITPYLKSWLSQFLLIFMGINVTFIGVVILQSLDFSLYLSLKIPFVFLFIFFMLNNIRFFIHKPNFMANGTHSLLIENRHLADKVAEEIEKCMEETELYLEDDIDLKTLADHLGHSERFVSEVINGKFGTNFYQFINGFRLKRAVALMKDDHNNKKLIKEIMYDSGFNNKVSFNNAFKNKYKLTPTQFRNTISNR